ncbi:Hypothetical predicted protein [Mytilus galloprovincialis]|uniref:Reverse transcriptase RNase H-like domain-containing protein n=1 Tax=Mytilus galloprovincialis TaxID=29158 RepID=A0A8B6EJA5_MYTGA|nr:Hypothetical predicted protein [Mytilus galloprovincialis]
MMEKVLINKFIRGLNNLDLQKHVQFQRANTLDTAISYAIEYEAFINPQNNMRKPMLTSNEQQYCTTKRELLAVIIFLCQFRHYLYGQKFTLRTDHASLKWLKNFQNPEGMIARWISIIDTYDMEIQHRKGSLHTNADGLSRTPKRKCKRINCPECTEMKTDIEYFENVKTTDCIDDLNTVKDGHASCLSVQSVINDTETDGDTDSVRGEVVLRPI